MKQDENVVAICTDCAEERKEETQRQLPGLILEMITAQYVFVKASFTEGEDTEHMWVHVSRIDQDKQLFYGTLDSKPVLCQLIKYEDSVVVPFSEVEDTLISYD